MVQAGERGRLSAAHRGQGAADTGSDGCAGTGLEGAHPEVWRREADRTRRGGAEWGEALLDRLTQQGRGRG